MCSKTAPRAFFLVVKSRPSINSLLIVPQKLCATALSQQSPFRLMLQSMPLLSSEGGRLSVCQGPFEDDELTVLPPPGGPFGLVTSAQGEDPASEPGAEVEVVSGTEGGLF